MDANSNMEAYKQEFIEFLLKIVYNVVRTPDTKKSLRER